MLKLLNPTIHGVLDYGLAIAFLLAPGLFGFSETAANLSYIFGVVYLGASFLTRYPLGVVKMIPFPVHGVLESIMAAAWIVLPWLLGFAADQAGRNFFLFAGVALLGVVVLTDYRATGTRRVAVDEERRHNMIDRRQRSLSVPRERRMGMSDRRGGRGFAT